MTALGHFYFTKLLLPQLFAGAKSSSDGKARVVNTSSSAADLASGIDINNIKDSQARKKRFRWLLYSESKLVCDCVCFSIEFWETISKHLNVQFRETFSFPTSWHEDMETRTLCLRLSILAT